MCGLILTAVCSVMCVCIGGLILTAVRNVMGCHIIYIESSVSHHVWSNFDSSK